MKLVSLDNNKMLDFKNKIPKKPRDSKVGLAWFEKKGIIIAFSLILGAGLLAIAFAVPSILISNIHTTKKTTTTKEEVSKPLPPATNV